MIRKLILCCDTGVDDAMAITYAAGQSQLQLLAVVTGFGMADARGTYRNTKRMLQLLGLDVPVKMGSEKPLVSTLWQDKQEKRARLDGGGGFHGRDGMGDMLGRVDEAEVAGAVPDEGIDFLVEMARRYGKELAVVTTGPLTDLARALEKAPGVMAGVGAVACMAGALACPGNTNEFAEANAVLDPHAARRVLQSDLPLTLVGLDVTRKTLLRPDDLARWQAIDTPAAKLLSGAVAVYLKEYLAQYQYLSGCALHDPLALAAVLHPEWFTCVPMHITCVTEGVAEGRTCEDLSRSVDEIHSTRGALFVDAKAFEEEFFFIVERGLAAAR